MTTLGAPMNYLVSHGPRADPVTGLTWGLMILSLAVVVIIGVLVPLGVVLRARRTADTASQPIERSGEGLWWIYIGLGLTIAALIAALFWTMQVLAAVNAPRHPTQLTIEVVGHQWWWEFRYLGAPGQAFTTANEMHIPVGRPVMLRLNGADVIHSFWVPALTGKTDTIPGRTNIGWLQADQPGVYAGMCTEYCGVQHAHMAVSVTAETPAAFETWRQGQINPAADVTTPPDAVAGRAVVLAHCGTCHTIRGTAAHGAHGPDLTHLMSRATLGAGILPNDPGALTGWIANPQALKPGVHMPATFLSGAQLSQARAYLETLR